MEILSDGTSEKSFNEAPLTLFNEGYGKKYCI